MDLEVIITDESVTYNKLNNAMVEEFSDGIMITADDFNMTVNNTEIKEVVGENESSIKYILNSGKIIEVKYAA